MALAGHPWRWAFFALLSVLAALAVVSLRRLSALDPRGWQVRFATPLLFGFWVLLFWELLTQSFDVPKVLLPAPTVVWVSLLNGLSALWTDFVQTVLHSVLIGLGLGSGLGFVTGVLIDRSPSCSAGCCRWPRWPAPCRWWAWRRSW
jgi:NitT/TauT family transport system permease protein